MRYIDLWDNNFNEKNGGIYDFRIKTGMAKFAEICKRN